MDIFEFEEKYKSTLEDIEEWAYLRIAVGFYLKNQNNNIKVTKLTFSQKLKNKFKVIQQYKNIFYGFRNWFRNYDYLFFSYSEQRKTINNKLFDKLSDPIIDRLSQGKSLLIETSNPVHYKINKIKTDFIVSRSLLDLFSRFVIFKNNKKDFSKLKSLLKLNNIDINIDKSLKQFQKEYLIYKLLFKLYKPKTIFIVCAYCNMGLVKASQDLNIKIIEMQHGVINNNHFGYISCIRLKHKYIPATLLSWGTDETKLIIKQRHPIGNFYIEYLKLNFNLNSKLISIMKTYRITIAISLQDQDFEFYGMLRYIKKVSKINKNILFILIPRQRKDFIALPSNVIIAKDLSCHDVVMHCDIHMTIYSSCCLEIPCFGIPNLLIDINKMASKYYKNIMDESYTKIISPDSPDDFKNNLNNLLNLEKLKILELHQDIIVYPYEKKIKQFLKEL